MNGKDIEDFLKSLEINKKNLANLIGVAPVSVKRWLENPTKDIPEKYAEEIKKVRPLLLSKKTIKQIILENRKGKYPSLQNATLEELSCAIAEKKKEIIKDLEQMKQQAESINLPKELKEEGGMIIKQISEILLNKLKD